jgi:hypothetical protein
VTNAIRLTNDGITKGDQMHDKDWYRSNYEFYKSAYKVLLDKKRQLEAENANLKWKIRRLSEK